LDLQTILTVAQVVLSSIAASNYFPYSTLIDAHVANFSSSRFLSLKHQNLGNKKCDSK
jgi:hypothetical protein